MADLLTRLRLRVTDHWFHRVTVPRYLSGIGAEDTVIDCGANVGVYTELLARKGATVHAFEPHPGAFARLKERASRFQNVRCHNKAVSDANGRMRLYLMAGDGSLAATQSASLMPQKDNISTEAFVDRRGHQARRLHRPARGGAVLEDGHRGC